MVMCMKRKFNLTFIDKNIRKYNRKREIKRKDRYFLDKLIKRLESYENIIKHYKSLLERIKLRYLED